MSGVAAQALSHVVRRGLEQFPASDGKHFNTMTPPPEANIEISTFTMLAIGAIGIMTLLLVASVDYTIGSVMASLAMIESPSTTTIVESVPPAYTDEPDAPLEKKGFVDTGDVEVVVINHKPITARVVDTIKHLHRVGGFFGRWRGLFQNIIYHMAINVAGHILGGLYAVFVGRFFGQAIGYTLAVVAFCRLRMLWTHAMIAMPTNTRWYKRFVPRKQCKPLLVPAMVYALAQQATFLLPLGVGLVMQFHAHGLVERAGNGDGWAIASLLLRGLSVPVTAILLALFVYLPAAAALTRVEACLLPADQETIVPFDREALVAGLDLDQRGSSKKLFVAAWKSFNNSARLRIIKLYVKLTAFQIAVMLVGLHLIGAVLYFTSKDQIVNAIQSIQA